MVEELDELVELELLELLLLLEVVEAEVEEEEALEGLPPPRIDVASVYTDCASDSRLLRSKVCDTANIGKDSRSSDRNSRILTLFAFLCRNFWIVSG